MAADRNDVVTLNVGGEVFQTTVSTLRQAGPSSPLSTLSPSPSPHFLDRDPALFTHLLSFLRHGLLPSPVAPSTLSELVFEAEHFRIQPSILSSLSHPSLFHPLSLSPSVSLPLYGRDEASAVSLSSNPSSLFVAHGGKVTAFDAAFLRRSTVLTSLLAIDSLLAVSHSVAAAGARDFPGLHLCSFNLLDNDYTSCNVLNWMESDSAAAATVQAIAASPSQSLVFASFESPRRNASSMVAFDLNKSSPVVEIGKKEVFGAEIESAIPAAKMVWLDGAGLLLAAGSHSGPAGIVGDVRLWDVRSNATMPVWEVREKEDYFADVAASDSLSAVFKVGVASGDVFMVDLRMIDTRAAEPWVCVGEGRKVVTTGRKEGSGCRIECYKKWVFVTRGGDVEVWTEVAMAPNGARKVMRRNLVGKGKDVMGEEKKKITSWAFGGSRMALARADERCVEVWDSVAAVGATVRS